jgi:diguanylate cyclase (GGDEF)-like protein/PAS domain S-box-containing protein
VADRSGAHRPGELVEPSNRTRPATVFAIAMTVVIGVHALLPAGPLRGVTYVGVELGAATAAFTAIRLHRPSRAAPWLLLGAALGTSGLVSLAWYAIDTAGGDPTRISPAYLVAFSCAFGAVWTVIRARSPQTSTAALLDTAIVTTGAGVLLWVFVVQPAWQAAGTDHLPRLLVATYPLFGLAMLAALLRLTFADGPRVASFRWLVTGVGVYFGVHVVESLPVSPPATGLEVLRLVSTAALAMAALHPSMRTVTEPSSPNDLPLSRWRLAALWSASVATPSTLLIELGAGNDGTVAVITVGSVTLFTLVVARMWGLLGTLRDVLGRQHEDRFQALVEHAAEIIYIIHPVRGLTYVSPAANHVWGYTTEELRELGSTVILPEDRPRMKETLRAVAKAPHGGVLRFEGRGLHADGGWRYVAATFANYIADPAIDGIVATCRDVTEQRELELQLTHQAFHDPLTGLPNRALFTDRTIQALGGRDRDRFAAVLFLDLDDFKSVNDGLGHETGDELLRITAKRLAASVRPEDTVARFGGDEFAVLLPRVRAMDTVTALAERLLTAVTEPVMLGTRRVEPTASLGIATSHDGPTAEELLRDADAAMYVAKRHGQGGFQVFDPRMHASALRRLQLKSDLRDAADRGELTVAYQTIHALGSQEVAGVEALLRWAHPVHGPIGPDEFIPLAEESGSIHRIGTFVLARACDDVVLYRLLTGLDVFLTVNVSGVQLSDLRLVDAVRTALERTGLPPGRLVLELTESVFVDDDEDVTATLRALERVGVQLAIDDFGTGYCSLSYLDRFRFDVVKVDRSFVGSLDDPQRSSRLTAGIFDLISSLGVPAVAEGVETAAQHEALAAIGCAYGQGYLWQRPVPIEELLLHVDLHAGT